MEVKDRNSSLRVTEPADSAPRLQRPIKDVVTLTPGTPVEETYDVRVQISAGVESNARAPMNDVISVINIAASAAEEIEGLVRHVDGILKQAGAEDVPENRLGALQREAAEAVKALASRGFSPQRPSITASLDESVRQELEVTLGRTLDLLLHDRVRSDFNLGKIDFSTSEAILQTQTSVAVAQKRIEQIKGDIGESQRTVERVLAADAVAAENRLAAEASVRDLDQASSLAAAAGAGIRENRDTALGSLGRLGERSLRVLES